MIKIYPSLLACDFTNIEKEIKKVETAGADAIHMDVMDGKFVPNISFGAGVIGCSRKVTNLPFDVHLMIENPLKYIKDFVDSGADIITFHVESSSNTMQTIEAIKNFGKKVGISLKPKTDIEILDKYLKYIDVVLVMTVEPGFGGQKFMEEQLSKVVYLKSKREKNNLNFEIELDGGINLETIDIVRKYEVDSCVSGTCVFKSTDISNTIKFLKYGDEHKSETQKLKGTFSQ